ncbi:MAG: TolC family protein [Bacteroidota bacterium]
MKNFIVIVFTLLCSPSSAQKITLQQAIEMALKNNFEISIEKNNTEIAKINNNIGMAGGLPLVSFNTSDQSSYIDINQKLNTGTQIKRAGTFSNSLNSNVSGTVILYNGYKIVSTKNRLGIQQKQSEQNLLAQIQNTIADVMMKYYRIVREQQYVITLEESINLTKKQLELVQTKKSVGLAGDAELFQSQIDLNSRILDLQSQQTVVKQSVADLAGILELKSDSSLLVSDSIVINTGIDLPAVLNAINTNPEISSLDNQIKINQLLGDEVASLRKPSLRLNTGYNFGSTQSTAGQLLLNRSYGPFVSFGLSVPIYSGGTVKRQQQTAALNSQNAVIKKESAINNQQTAAIKTFQTYESSITQLNTQQSTLQLSKQLAELSLQRFQLNSATSVEVREAQKSLEEAGFRLVNLQYVAKIAEIELLRLSNQLH